jgi:hypothetical protein
MVISVDELRVCDEALVFEVEVLAEVTAMTYAPATFTVPAALLVSTPLANDARAGFETVHSVLAVTSCVVPSVKCAVALSATEPPAVTEEGVAVIDRVARPWGAMLALAPQPAVRISALHRRPEHTCDKRGIRMCIAS